MGSIYEGELEAMKIATEYARQTSEVDPVFLIRKGARLSKFSCHILGNYSKV